MKRLIALLAACLALGLLVSGASGRDAQIGPQAIVCTIYQPQVGAPCSAASQFTAGYSYFWFAADQSNPYWAQSPSTARRYDHSIQIWGECLPAHAYFRIRYVRQNGQVYPGSTWSSAPGACGFGVDFDSGGTYVWAQCQIVTTGAPVYRWTSCATNWN